MPIGSIRHLNPHPGWVRWGDKGDRGSSGGCKADCCAIGAPRDASPYNNQAVLQACKWEKAAVPPVSTPHPAPIRDNSALRSREVVCRIAFFDDSFWFVLAVSAIEDAGRFVQLGVLNGISVGDEGWHGVTGHALWQMRLRMYVGSTAHLKD